MTFKPFRYAFVFFASLVVIELLLFAVGYFLQQDMRNMAMGLIPFMGAAMFEGTKYAQTTRAPIPSPWKQAAAMTGIGFAVSIVLAIPFVLGFPSVQQVLAEYPVYVLGAFAVMALIATGVTRFFYGFGAKNQWKSDDMTGAS